MPFNALVLAQAETAPSNFIYLLVVVICGFVLPILAGRYLAKRFRAVDYGWKLSLVFVFLALASMTVGRSWDPEKRTFKIPLGVDLKGGVILIYEIDDEARLAQADGTEGPANAGRFKMDALISALSRRINPSGTKEIVLRKYGDRQVEIIIPEVDTLEVEVIKKKISTAGMLVFRIVANRRDHDETIALATEMANDPVRKRSTIVRDASNKEIGLWARVAREDPIDNIDGELPPLKFAVSANDLVRDTSTGELLNWTRMRASNARDADGEVARLQEFLDQEGIRQIDILMATDDGYDVTGADLGVVSQGTDERLNPCINFNLRGKGIDNFADLTRDNEPGTDGFHRQLGILLDNQLLSAPNIQEMINRRGRITGSFTQAEVAFMVNILDAGSLPMVLNPVPISESVISPLLGEQTIKQGKWAMLISLSAVLIFIIGYYRFSGVVASLALLTNLLFIMAVMITIKAAFTLPGLAGLVLTVGMSVDANVLIFERIREEIAKGSAFRMAIRNGFGRATTTIVDANVTTLITAIVLYAIGTDQIRGFAVTLILGILMSMFTAIFCSRIIFDVAEKSRRLSLNMGQLVGATQIDFIGKRRVAAVFSIVLITAGIVGLTLRGADIFDIDFRGGTSVHLTLNKEMKTDEVRATLGPMFEELHYRYTISAMNFGGSDTNSVFKVDSAMPEVDQLQKSIQEAFQQTGEKSPLATYSLESGQMRTVPIGLPNTTDASQTGTSAGGATTGNETNAATPDTATPDTATPDTATPDTATPDTATPDTATPETAPADQTPAADAAPTAESTAEPAQETDGAKPAADSLPPTDGTRGTDSPPTPAPGETPDASEAPAPDEGARSLQSTDNLLALAGDSAALIEQAEPDAAPTEEAIAQTTPRQPPTTEAGPATAPTSTDEEEPADPADDPSVDGPTGAEAPIADPTPVTSTQVEVELKFEHAINYDTLTSMIAAAMEDNQQTVFFELQNSDYHGGSNAFPTWTLQISDSEEQTQKLLDKLESQFADKPVWRSSNKIGSQVAGRMQNKAIFAFLTCLLGIILYIWIRFQRVIFGLAAVVALVHDVLVTLGAIALSYWLAGIFGFLLIEEFKISLPIVAALLTIIGYSLNDTIVVFDRIREVRGKSPDLTGEMINKSINQTLSRTILTSLTTLVVVLILYFIGGDGIHGFAFALVVGVTVGTYSSIFVASPVLLWMTGTKKSRPQSRAA